MPNWCQNYVIFRHENAEMNSKLLKAADDNKLFETFVPLSSGEWDYSTAIEEWGTKWEAKVYDCHETDDEVTIYFETAWTPSIRFFEAMTKLGFEVDVFYHESGMCFAGRYTSDDGNYSIEYNFDNENWRDEIDDDNLIDFLETEYELYKEMMEDED